MRVSAVTAVLLALLGSIPVAAQAPAAPPEDLPVRPDLRSVPAGALDLSGLSVIAGADDGFYTDISTGPDGLSVSGTVEAVAFGPDGSLYVAGRFSTAGDVPAQNVARWDGAAWHALGDGVVVGTFYPHIRALVVGPDGSVYVGGGIVTAGGAPVSGIARWDGTSWDDLGGGLGGMDTGGEHAKGLAVGVDGSVYAAGRFASAGGVPANSVARWDGVAWHALGSGLDGYADALARGPDGSLYVGGYFSTAGGVPARNVARWDGTAWSALGSGVHAAYALATDASGNVYAAGTTVSRWDGTSWNPIGGAFDSVVRSLAVGTDESLYASGYFTAAGDVPVAHVARWNGGSWNQVGGGLSGATFALAVEEDGDLYAGGGFSTAGGQAANALARWDGATWHGFGSAVNSSVQALVRDPAGGVYVGGTFSTVGDLMATGVSRWDGSAWHTLGEGIVGDVYALTVGPDDRLYAGGYFYQAGGVPENTVVRWDGTSWTSLGGADARFSKALYALAIGPDGSVYAGGRSIVSIGPPGASLFIRGIARWDGTDWNLLGTGEAYGVGGSVYALAFGPDGSLYVGGRFAQAGDVPANGIARWDGAAWHAVGDGVSGADPYVFSLTFGRDGALYVGGRFTTAGGVPANGVARWDGTAWHAVGVGTSGGSVDVWALAFGPDGNLYAGGDFAAIGGQPARGAARWDGTAWHDLAGGMDGSVRSLTSDAAGDVFVGGFFDRAGGVVSPNLARYTPGPVASEPETGPETLALVVSPNPTRGAATATVTHPAGPVTVEVVDALGRRVAVVAEGAAAAGTRVVDLPLGGLAPGVYVVRVVAGREVVTRSVVVVR
ncbi:MAG TPA: T9SS type A sorting domain-containing protein [Rubricoccaceae bacterium]